MPPVIAVDIIAYDLAPIIDTQGFCANGTWIIQAVVFSFVIHEAMQGRIVCIGTDNHAEIVNAIEVCFTRSLRMIQTEAAFFTTHESPRLIAGKKITHNITALIDTGKHCGPGAGIIITVKVSIVQKSMTICTDVIICADNYPTIVNTAERHVVEGIWIIKCYKGEGIG